MNRFLQALANLFRIEDLRKRVLFTLALLAVYRIGAHIPTPGINSELLNQIFAQAQGTALGIFDLFSGGNFRRLTIFALGIMPYITSSIILQLMTVVFPYLERLQKEGELGRRKITQYTRYLTVAPGKTGEELGVRERQAFGKNEESAVLLLENGGFEVSFRGSKAMQQDRFDRYKDSTFRNIFYILRHRLREPGMIFESRGADVVDNVPVEIVEITDSQNRVVKVNFHQSTKLPVRQSYSRLDPKTRERNDEVSLFNRYRDTGGGVQWPHQILRERNGEKIYEIFSETVKIDTGVADNVFNVPAPAPERKKK